MKKILISLLCFLMLTGECHAQMVRRAESDPNVKLVEGIVKSNGSTISAAIAGIDFLEPDGNGSSLVGVATISGTFDAGNLLTTNSSGEIIDAEVPAPSGPYGDMVGSGDSVSDFIPVYSGTSGKAIVTSGVSVSGASKDNLTVPGTVTAGTITTTSSDPTKIGNVSGGDYVQIDNTGWVQFFGDAGINWSDVNPISTDGINWTQWTDDTSVNWSAVTKLEGGGSVSFSDTSPALAAGTGAGTSPTINIEGSDSSGVIYITTGSSPATSATLATITFDSTYTHIPTTTLIPMNANAAALSGAKKPYVDWASGSTTTSVLKTGSTALDGATDYIWGYLTVGH